MESLFNIFGVFLTILDGIKDKPVEVSLRRDGQTMTKTLVKAEVECVHPSTRKPITVYDAGFGLGVAPYPGMSCRELQRPRMNWESSLSPQLEEAKLSIDEALLESLRQTGEVIVLISSHLFKLFVTQEVSTETLGGPLQFFDIAKRAAQAGILVYLRILAIISI